MTEFVSGVQQNRDTFIEARFEFRIGVNIEDVDTDAEFRRQRLQRFLHIVAEVAIRTRNQCQA